MEREITIPLEDYKNLLEISIANKYLYAEITKCIKNAELDYWKKDLTIDNKELNGVLKRHFEYTYNKRVKELNEKEVKTNE